MEIRLSRNGSAVHLPTDSWYGNRRFGQLYNLRPFEFPKSWDIHFFEPDRAAEMQPLSDAEIGEGVRTPIGASALRKLAESRKDAVIIVDDLSRPTPAYAVIPHVLEELQAGGITPENTTIIIGLGTHRPITRAEQRRKLGKEIVDSIRVVNHSSFTRRLKTYRRLNGGPDFSINRIVGDADLKISVSGILTHGGAGFGGGGKAILPSVAAYKTIRYNHSTFVWEGNGIVYPRQITSPGIRRDMELCAREVGLDYSVNVVYSPLKEVLGIFGGDFVDAHRAGCRKARDLFLTTPPKEQLDIVISNSHPMDTDIGQSHRGTWPEAYGKQSVLVASARDGWAYHGDGGKSYRTYRQLQKSQKPLDSYRFKGTAESANNEARAYFSPTIGDEIYYEQDGKRRFYSRWEHVIAGLDGTGQQKTVGIFPYASMQIESK